MYLSISVWIAYLIFEYTAGWQFAWSGLMRVSHTSPYRPELCRSLSCVVHLNTPLQIVAIPISDICCLCFEHGKAFVRTLAVWLWPWQLWAFILFYFTICLIEWYLISMCLAHWWNCGFLAIATICKAPESLRLNLSSSVKWRCSGCTHYGKERLYV